jgi:uncharacterized RDD family membrane protein YckC
MICLTDVQIWEATVTTPDNPTPDKPAPQEDSGTPRSEAGAAGQTGQTGRAGGEAPGPQIDPQEALKGLHEQPRVDEQGHPTAYTAVPPPLGEQQQGAQPQQQQQQGAQPPPYANGQAGQYGQQAGQYGQQGPYGRQQQPVGQAADAHSPFGAERGRQASYGEQPPPQQPYGGGQGQQQPYGGQTPQDQPPPGYGYPPPPPGYETYGTSPYGEGHVPGMPPYASWGQRAGAWLIDNLVAAVGISLLDVSFYDWGHGVRILSWVIAAVGVVWAVYNAYLAGQTGQSTGKRMLGIRLGRYVDGQVIGWPFGVLRLFMNAVFWAICFIPGLLNYLWPLWDQKSQTWSDKIASSVVVRAR